MSRGAQERGRRAAELQLHKQVQQLGRQADERQVFQQSVVAGVNRGVCYSPGRK